jgi:hypothetical protein
MGFFIGFKGSRSAFPSKVQWSLNRQFDCSKKECSMYPLAYRDTNNEIFAQVLPLDDNKNPYLSAVMFFDHASNAPKNFLG